MENQEYRNFSRVTLKLSPKERETLDAVMGRLGAVSVQSDDYLLARAFVAGLGNLQSIQNWLKLSPDSQAKDFEAFKFQREGNLPVTQADILAGRMGDMEIRLEAEGQRRAAVDQNLIDSFDRLREKLEDRISALEMDLATQATINHQLQEDNSELRKELKGITENVLDLVVVTKNLEKTCSKKFLKGKEAEQVVAQLRALEQREKENKQEMVLIKNEVWRKAHEQRLEDESGDSSFGQNKGINPASSLTEREQVENRNGNTAGQIRAISERNMKMKKSDKKKDWEIKLPLILLLLSIGFIFCVKVC